MTKLSVNINKLATLRNSRGKNNPDVVKGALDIVGFGAQGITVHPRPDERHIRRSDVGALKAAALSVELNIEGYPSRDFLQLVLQTKPAQCTLVPDPPEALTSNAGWKVIENQKLLAETAGELSAAGIRSSVFIDATATTDQACETLKRSGVDRIELYTESYAETFGHSGAEKVLAEYVRAAEIARKHGLGINAGHDLTSDNLTHLIAAIPWIDEVSIGHALVCDALYWGLEKTVQRYLAAIASGTRAAATQSKA